MRPLRVLAGAAAILAGLAAPEGAGAATITHVFDRSTTFANLNMCWYGSSGASLADQGTASGGGSCAAESSVGDIAVTFK